MLWRRENRGLKEDRTHSVEIIAHKGATKDVVERAKDANEKLKQLFDENGFTVKIVLAMGARQQRGKVNNHGH